MPASPVQSASRAHRTSPARRPLAEAIEGRLLLAASIIDGVLTVDGTAGNDELLVNFLVSEEYIAVVNGVGQSFGAGAGVTSVVVNGFEGNDTIRVLRPTVVPVLLNGGAGNDTVEGNNGAETLDGGEGSDVLTGNGGSDTVTYAGRTAPITAAVRVNFFGDPAAPGSATFGGGGDAAAAEADVYSGIDAIVGGSGDDSLDLLAQQAGAFAGVTVAYPTIAARLDGGAGDDVLTVGPGAGQPPAPTAAFDPTILGGAGDDVILYTATTRGALSGGDGDDTFRPAGGGVVTSVDPGTGNDQVNGSGTFTVPSGIRRVVAAANSEVTGNDEDNDITIVSGTVHGGGGNDRITILIRGAAFGDDGDDTLRAAGVLDASLATLLGGDGADLRFGLDPFVGVTLGGGAGADRIYGSNGPDRIEAGSGRDRVWGNGAGDRIYGGAGSDILRGGAGQDRIDGDEGDDRVAGDGGDDRVYGSEGNDVLTGDAGDDRLYGGDGDDDLYGGVGRDILYGGAGSDSRQRDPLDVLFDGIESAFA